MYGLSKENWSYSSMRLDSAFLDFDEFVEIFIIVLCDLIEFAD